MKTTKLPVIKLVARSMILVAAICAAFLFSPAVQAQTSVWTGTAGDGLWSDAGNWTGGVPNGIAAIADFSQYNLSANTTVHLDEPISVAQIIIGNTDVSPTHSWTFDDNGNAANVLTNGDPSDASGVLTVTVTNMGAGLADFTTMALGTTGGLLVNGGGQLEVDNTNYLAGGVTVAGATFILGTSSLAAPTPANAITLGANNNSAPSVFYNYAGGFVLGNPINGAPGAAGPIIVGAWKGQKAVWGAPSTINLNGDNLIITNGTADGNHFQLSDNITNYGSVTFNDTAPTTCALTMPGFQNIGSVTLESDRTVSTGMTASTLGAGITNLTFAGNWATLVTAPVTTNYVNPSAGVTIVSTAPSPTTNNITLPATTATCGGSNVTLNANSSGYIQIATVNASFKGNILNSGTGTGPALITANLAAAGISNVIQYSATSPMILAGANSYASPTLVSNGWVLVNGINNTVKGTSYTVYSGGTLSGKGLIANVVTVNFGGTLAPGTNDGYTLGALTLTNNGTLLGGLSLNGNLFFKLNKTVSPSNDMVNMFGVNALNNTGTGTLTLTNVLPGTPIVRGDRFVLFTQPLVGGNTLTISSAYGQWTNNLAVDGSVIAGDPAPTITSVAPNTGPTSGGTPVTITGTGFITSGTTTVNFGANPGTSVTVNSSTSITVTTPSGSVGAVNVTVTDPDGQIATSVNAFTYSSAVLPPAPTVSSVSPTYGPTAGGTVVTITGNNFTNGVGDVDTVMFGSTPGTGVTVVNTTTITVTAPAELPGTVSVSVTDGYSQSGTLPSAFTYYPPAITSLTPTTGPTAGGTPITITGSNFVSGDTVTFGGVAGSSVVVVNSTTIDVNTPVHAAGAVNVVVTDTQSQSSTLAGGYTFTSPAPGVWVAPNGGGDGLWTGDTANWSNSVVPNAVDQTADFSQGDYTGSQSVHVDTTVTIGNAIFGTTDTGTPVQWTVDNNSTPGNTLTLQTAIGTPTVNVEDPLALGNNAAITAVVAGNQGLALTGGGMLTLGVSGGATVNTFTGGVTIANGTLLLENNAGDANTNDVLTLGSTNAGTFATLMLETNFANPIVLATNDSGSNTISGDPNTSPRVSLVNASPVNLNGSTLTFVAVNSTGNSLLANGVTGSGNLVLVQNGGGTVGTTTGTFNNSGSITLQGAGYGHFNLGTVGNITALNYNSSSATITGVPTISVNPTNGTAINSGSTLNLSMSMGAGDGPALVFNCNSSGNISSTWAYNFGGNIINSGTGTGATTIPTGIYNTAGNPLLGVSNMIEDSATSPLILAGADWYSAPTIVTNGWLLWNGPIINGSQRGGQITVYTNGVLSGVGMRVGLDTIWPGGTLAPGTNDGYTLGTLTFTNNSSLTGGLQMTNANLFFKLNPGLTQSNDYVVEGTLTGVSCITNNGLGSVLTVTNVGPNPLYAGEVFQLFSTNVVGGNNITIVGPASFVNNLAVNGSIQVSGGAPPPSITSLVPNTGSTNGGTLVAVNGANFQSGATVQFGAASPITATFVNSTELTVTTPVNTTPGAVTVTVENPDTQTATSSYTYILPPPPASTSSVSESGGNLILVWQGGTNQSCVLMSATNLAPPIVWTPVTTNTVGAGGLSTNTIPVNPGQPHQFYQLAIPYN